MWKNIATTKTWSQEESRELSIVSPKLGMPTSPNRLWYYFPGSRLCVGNQYKNK